MNTYRSFISARSFARKLNLKTWDDWREYCKSGRKPDDIPARANSVYKHSGWISFSDWLKPGITSPHRKRIRSFHAARTFVRSLNLKSNREWEVYCQSGKKPDDIPAGPHLTYACEGWKGYGDWLGTGAISTKMRTYRSFEKARSFAQDLKLKNVAEWEAFCRSGKKPDDIPRKPDGTYAKKGWEGYGDWLGTGNLAPGRKVFRSFGEARAFVHGLNLQSVTEWREYCRSGKKPANIPAYPNEAYAAKGWKGIPDWLGKTKAKGGV